MNAVIMLVWLAGADAAAPAQKPAPDVKPVPTQKPAPGYVKPAPGYVKPAPGYVKPAPGHIHPAPAGVIGHGSHCDSCDTCCDNGGHGLLSRLRGLFHRRCDDCCDDGCGGHKHFHHRHQDSCCDDGGGHRLFGFLHRSRHADCCEPCCEESCGHKLLSRFRNIFRRHDDCCPTDCCTSTGPAVIHPHPVRPGPGGKPPEKIGPPKDAKKMPEDKKTQLLTPPPANLTLEAPGLNLDR